MFCVIALGALWHPLGVVHFLVCATRVLQRDSKKLQKQFKTSGLEHFWGILLGEANLDHMDNRRVPMQRETRFSFLRSVLMQRGAHFH